VAQFFLTHSVVTDILSRTVSELRIAAYCSNFGHYAFLSHPFGPWGQRTIFILGSSRSA